MPRPRPFGVSTHLFHGQRLSREHLAEIGGAGFEQVELYATRTHFDYHNTSVIADLQGWLASARLELHSVHAPVGESFANGRWGPQLSLASPDAATRDHALAEAEAALHVARRIPFKVLIVHLGVPRTPQSPPGENNRDAARRSVEALVRLATPLGVSVAVEIIANDLSRPPALVHFVETVADGLPLGICLDTGHAHMGGDLAEAIETVSEHLIAAHVHDNRGRTDDHLPPYDGTIDWPAALTTMQKVGYDGPLMFEVGAQGQTKVTLQKLKAIRAKMEQALRVR